MLVGRYLKNKQPQSSLQAVASSSRHPVAAWSIAVGLHCLVFSGGENILSMRCTTLMHTPNKSTRGLPLN